MSFLPDDFVVPAALETARMRLRGISVADLAKDYEAVMSSRERLWGMFGEAWGWPAADLTIEQDRRDLAWHENEYRTRSSFDYAVMSPDEERLLGCFYIDPPRKAGYDAEAYYWVRDDERGSGLEEHLSETGRRWVIEAWPFSTVAFPGRDVTWADWNALPDR